MKRSLRAFLFGLLLMLGWLLPVHAQQPFGPPMPAQSDLQALIDNRKHDLALEIRRGQAASRKILTNTANAADALGDAITIPFFGRRADFDKFVQTVQDADLAFKSGDSRGGLKKSVDAFRQALNSPAAILLDGPEVDMPKNPKEAVEFVKKANEILSQATADGKVIVMGLARTG